MTIENPFAGLIEQARAKRASAAPTEPQAEIQPVAPQAPSGENPFADLIAKAKANRATPGQSALTGAADAATFSFGDEMAGGLRALVQKAQGDPRTFREIYNTSAERIRGMVEKRAADNPGAFLAGQVGGGIATAVLPAGKVAQGAGMVSKVGRGAAAGAGLGAAQGAGSGVGLQDRIMKALQGASIGAAVGTVAAPIAAGVGNVAGRIKRSLGTRKVARAAQVPQKSLQKVTDALKEDRGTGTLRAATKGDMVMNLGPSLSSSAEGIATQPGRGANILLKAGKEQADAEGGRIRAVVDRTLGKDKGRVLDASGVEAERKAAGQLYEVAKASQTPIYTGPIRQKLDELVAATDGAPRNALEGLRELRVFKQIGQLKGRGDRSSAMDLHAARIAIDSAIETAGKGSTVSKFLGDIRREVDNALKQSAPGYKDADVSYKAAMDAKSALEEGRNVFSRSYGSPDELRAELGAMAPSVRERFVKGARDFVSMTMGTARNDALAARREMFDKGWNREKLAILIGQSQANRLSRALEAAGNRAKGYSDLQGNSRTAMRTAAAQKRFPGQVDASRIESQLSKTTLTGAGAVLLVKFANKVAGNAIASGINKRRDKIGEGAAKLLSASDRTPVTRDQVMSILAQAERAKGKALNVREQYDALTNALAVGAATPREKKPLRVTVHNTPTGAAAP